MTVAELIALLQQQDPNAEVLSGDNDHSYYDIGEVVGGLYIVDGYEVSAPGTGGSPEAPEGTTPCVVVRPF